MFITVYFFYTLCVCVCVRRSWTKMRRAGRRRSSRWRTIVSSWRRRSTTGTTRPCSSWRRHSNSKWPICSRPTSSTQVTANWKLLFRLFFKLILSPKFVYIGTVTQQLTGCLSVRYQLVLQETVEERLIVTKNLASIFTTATNHLAVTEVTFFSFSFLIIICIIIQRQCIYKEKQSYRKCWRG